MSITFDNHYRNADGKRMKYASYRVLPSFWTDDPEDDQQFWTYTGIENAIQEEWFEICDDQRCYSEGDDITVYQYYFDDDGDMIILNAKTITQYCEPPIDMVKNYGYP